MDKRRSQCLEKREEKNYICCHIFHKSYLLASRMPWFFKGLINFWKPFPYTKKRYSYWPESICLFLNIWICLSIQFLILVGPNQHFIPNIPKPRVQHEAAISICCQQRVWGASWKLIWSLIGHDCSFVVFWKYLVAPSFPNLLTLPE